jgi:hypothetical protein
MSDFFDGIEDNAGGFLRERSGLCEECNFVKKDKEEFLKNFFIGVLTFIIPNILN